MIAFFLTFCLQAFSEQSQAYVFKGDCNYPPFEYNDENGNPTGFNVELLEAIGEVSHLDIQIELGIWSEVYGQLSNGEIDGITGMYLSKNRQEQFLFSVPHNLVTHVIITRPKVKIESIDELRNKNIVVQENDVAHDYLVENKFTDRILFFDNPLIALGQFIAGKGDALIVSRIHAYYFRDKLNLEAYNIIPLSPNMYSYCFVLNRDHADLLAQIDEGINILQQTGKYQQLKQKWFNQELAETMPEFLSGWWRYLAIVLVLVALGFIVWSGLLGKKVNKQTRLLKSELNAKIAAERQLRTVLDRLTIAQRSAGIGIWELNLTNMDLYWDDGMFELYEKDREKHSATYVEWVASLHPNDREQTKKHFDACIQNRMDYDATFRITSLSGKQKYIRAYAKLTFSKHNMPLKAVGVNWDVTKTMEDAVVNDVLHSISQAAIFSENLVGFMEKIRQELSRVVDTTNFFIGLMEDGTGKLYLPYMKDNVEEFNYFPIKNSISNFVIQQKKSMLFYSEDLDDLHKNGTIERAGGQAKVWLGVPLQIENQVIGLIVLQSYSDRNAITEDHVRLLEYIAPQLSLSIKRKKIQDELVKSEEALRKITQQLKEAQVIAQMGNFEWDEKSQLFTFSDEIYSIFGIEKESENPDFEAFKALLHSEDCNEFLMILSEVSESKTSFETECRVFNNETGESRIIIIKGQPVMKNGKYSGYFSGILQDITDQKDIEYELMAAKEKAEQSDKLKSAFLANMSHEIRTPMNSILGFSQILTEAEDQEELERFTSIINTNGEHLLKLIDDIIDISKVEAGLLKIDNRNVDVDVLAENTLFQFKEEDSVKNGDVVLKLVQAKKKVGLIFADQTKIKQVLINLIYNALKFTNSGHIELRYRVVGKAKVRFEVEDTGIGIPGDKLNNIFDRFMQVNTNGVADSSGAGLGLSLCKSYVKLMGGDIKVKSVLDKGSVFSFEIPIQKVKSELPRIEVAEEPVPLPQAKRPTILIAEDDKDSFLYFETIMQKSGFDFIHVETGKDAVEKCRTHKEIDLVLMDVRMPVMDGLMATREIKLFKKDLPIVAQTAHAMDGDRQKALDAGCDDYIAKPVQRKILMEKITALLPKNGVN